MIEDHFGKGKPLTPAGLLQLLTDEVYKDGVVEPWEKQVLQRIAAFLNISAEKARAIEEQSRTKYAEGELGSRRPLDTLALYKKVLYFVVSDLEIDYLEAKMLEGLRDQIGRAHV